MSAIPQNISDALIQLLAALLSGDNKVRQEAEQSLNKDWTKKDRIDVLLVFLAHQAANGADVASRSFAAVLFRRFAIKSPSEQGYSVTARQIDHIGDAAKQEIRNVLLQGFASAQENSVRHKLADAIAEVAKDTKYEWPNLLPTVLQSTTNDDWSFRESAYRIISTTPFIISNYQLEETLKIFHLGFEDANDDVRIAACSAFVAFFQDLPKSEWSKLSQLLPNLLNSLPRFLENGQEAALASVLESLIELVELAPKLFKPMFPTIIQFCSEVAKNKELDSSARLAALELMTTFCETSPNMCKREPTYASTMVVVTLQLMTEVCIDDEDCAEWNNSDDLNDDEDEEEYNAARQSLDRASLRLGGQSLAGPLFQYLPQMIQSQDWHERQASLMALSSATEGCREVLMGEIPRILDLILPSLQDPHPRVQYACCNALGQMSTDFADVIQRTSGDRILPALISMLSTRNVPRVQAHAACALVNFSDDATKEVLEPYLDDLLSNLLTLLQSAPKRYVQEQVITTIAIVADNAKNKFYKYYDTLMPLLIDVLRADMGEENRLLKAKSIECSTLIALAVGKEKFSSNAQELVQILAHLQSTLTGDDDPVKTYLEQGWGRICKLIGKDFIPYLPGVLPPLLEAAKATQDISVVEEEELEDINQNEEYEVIQLSGKHIAVHTAILDDKTGAIELLKNYAEVLGGDFFPYVEEVATEIVIPGLDFYVHDGVRGSAALCMPALLTCTVEATGSNKSPQALQLWSQMFDKLVAQLGSDPVLELLVAYFYAITKCLEIMGGDSLTDTQLAAAGDSIKTNLTETYKRIKDRDSADDEYNEEIQEDEEEYTDEEFLDEVTKGITAIFKSCRSRFLPAFQSMISVIASFLNDENISLKLLGLCAVSDLVEFTGPESYQFKDLFMNPVGESLTSPQAAIRQSASYCVGVCAQYGGSAYSEYCQATLPSMIQMCNVPDSKAEDNLLATENSIAAIAKIMHSFGTQIPNLNELIENWFKLMPVLQDDEAAPFAYMFLIELIQQQHPIVMNQIPKTVDDVMQAVMVASIGGKTAEKAIESIKLLLGSLPQDQAMALVNNYGAEGKAILN
ncbi:hypothetical protein CANARDRAFT_10457 [[Candida] arabinofermentans NRRL YB-2248]|uniref:Importin N-terminal domain-containing protein n=1 Tax=[Candida] arabinofermentans NRRL YB-2248 TaxID=983967 RepID=A0A1E4SSQ7_9ASCO|nr:hypothetical protein CANARDRAFT_10457 [[Candida] arabinofermentans NRRL YB-2248]